MDDNREILFTAAKGIVGGSSATIAAFVAPWQEHTAWALGIVVALATLVSLVLDIRRKIRRKKD